MDEEFTSHHKWEVQVVIWSSSRWGLTIYSIVYYLADFYQMRSLRIA